MNRYAKRYLSLHRAAFGLVLAAAIASASATEHYWISDGKLERPTGYREWIYVGTPVTPNDMNNGKAAFPEHHNVYIDPVSWAHWKETGEFREGTILIKELVSVGTKVAVSGNGYFQGEFTGFEHAVKDAPLAEIPPDSPSMANTRIGSGTGLGEPGGVTLAPDRRYRHVVSVRGAAAR